MLNENIKNLRRQKGMSQDELANKLHVVRQTVSKWENGLSVPDSSLLISLADILDVNVADLLGETIEEKDESNLDALSKKIETINLILYNQRIKRIKTLRLILICLNICIVGIFILLYLMQSSYLNWDYSNTELAISGTLLHGFEFLFVRIAPIIFVVLNIIIIIIYKKH